ncbi:hypothetical protein HK096_009420 [Nowakowskiella sp. JEL0078]|nr:hypothetical protein HK096_009420 [Nowakowskiella sp. JEL0078]
MQLAVKVVHEEIEEHASYREPMDKYYISQPKLREKAQLNWIRKNNFLVHEYEKYTTYVSRLQQSTNSNIKFDDLSETTVNLAAQSTIITRELQNEEKSEKPKDGIKAKDEVERLSISVNDEQQVNVKKEAQNTEKNNENAKDNQCTERTTDSVPKIQLTSQSPMSVTFESILLSMMTFGSAPGTSER